MAMQAIAAAQTAHSTFGASDTRSARRPDAPVLTPDRDAHDPVHRPQHYYGRTLQAIDVIENWGLGFHLGNALKYVLRANRKVNRDEDLQKAIWYLRRAERLQPVQLCVGRSRRVIDPLQVITDFDLPGGSDGELGLVVIDIHRASCGHLPDATQDACREGAVGLTLALGQGGA